MLSITSTAAEPSGGCNRFTTPCCLGAPPRCLNPLQVNKAGGASAKDKGTKSSLRSWPKFGCGQCPIDEILCFRSDFGMNLYDRLIIGAGLTGLWLGHLLKLQNKNCQLIDKSKGVGGRMATRRWNDQKFDHGAQFYKLKTESQEFHKLMLEKNLVRPLDNEKWIAVNGISSLAKSLASQLPIFLEKTVDKISRSEDGTYQVSTVEGHLYQCRKLILTCPLPQTLKIFDQSNFIYPEMFKNVQYSKALVFLLSSQEVLKFPYSAPYYEPQDSNLFSVVDQNWKTGISGTAWTVTMAPDWSHQYFDQTEEEQLIAFKNEFTFYNSIFNIQIKKWRYSQPSLHHSELTSQIKDHPNIYIAGDAIGGGSLNGAIRSAENILNILS